MMSIPKNEQNAAAGNLEKALIVLSGGQDSSTCLYWALEHFKIYDKDLRKSLIKTVTFDYGQRHKIEIDSARKICKIAEVDFDLVKIPEILRSTSPLVNNKEELDQYEKISDFKPGVQPTFVPGRNILFMTIAANIAVYHGIKDIVLGLCEEDFGGYYDCREDFVTAMQKALNQGLFGKDTGLTIHTPLMHLNKADSVKLIKRFGTFKDECLAALAYSHTCYAGLYPPCGKCHACLLRARGFNEAGIPDPLLYRDEPKLVLHCEEDASPL